MNLYNYEEKVNYVKNEVRKCIKYDKISGLESIQRDVDRTYDDLKALRNNNYEKRDDIDKAIKEIETLQKDIKRVLDSSKENKSESSLSGLAKFFKVMYRITETPVDILKDHLGL